MVELSGSQRTALNRMAARKLQRPNLLGVSEMTRLRGLELVRDANKERHFLNDEVAQGLDDMIHEILFRRL
jgi:hypothetical protein